jgi:adenosylcobinamide-phosphate synthase
MADPVALAALAVEAAVGWPRRLYLLVGHPVGLFARVIQGCERRWNKGDDRRRRLGGIATTLVVAALAVLGAGYAELVVRGLLNAWAWPALALLAVPGLAQRGLYDHVLPVAQALRDGELPAARAAVAHIVGRDTDALDEGGTARAAIESLSESFCDAVVAPVFWLVLLGLPGLYAYKAINTADSLIGHKEAPFRDFGWAAARTDDVANWVPARIAGALICLAGGRGWRVMWSDARRHDSPNAGWPEAAMAGVLGLRLGGPVRYDGVWHDKPWLRGGRADAGAADIDAGLGVYRNACLLLWGVAGAAAWLR